MAFKLTDEQRMIQLMVREFAKKEIEPVASEYEKKEIFPQENLKKMAELGLMGMMIPPEYGGSGVGTVSYSIAMQEIAYACASTSVAMSVSNLSCEPILMFGSEEQKRRFLTPLASGKYLGAFALTEPEAGSDPASLRTRAILKGDSYFINGSKTFITNGSYADIFIVTARTQEGVGGKGLSSFILEKGTPGFSVGKKEDKMGLRAADTVGLVFEDCQVPKENLLGQEGDGFEIVMVALDGGRIGIASQAVGIAQACLDESVKYAKSRQQFGRYISKFQAIQWMIADMTTEIEAARLLTFNAASMKDDGLNFTREVSMAKLFASEMVNRVAYKALQIHGGYGYIKDYKVERLYRDARATTIYEGTSEVQRIVIARSALK
ncbi:MAG: acyl-CoA dehydrogenase [Armatimonadetes bacterium CG07_land_8_20_14_0_80_40_9]|nr:MAG: acyl-CoA dehydrogenase [Armatimonadetes bacterium CG07_land_8_20_14_0_80_40_9]